MRSTPRRRSDASTSRRRLAGLPTRRGAFVPVGLVPDQAALGEHVGAVRLGQVAQRPRHDLLGVAEAVHGRGVHPVDPGLDRVPDGGDRVVVFLVSPGEGPASAADRPGAEAGPGDGHAGLPERNLASVTRSCPHAGRAEVHLSNRPGGLMAASPASPRGSAQRLQPRPLDAWPACAAAACTRAPARGCACSPCRRGWSARAGRVFRSYISHWSRHLAVGVVVAGELVALLADADDVVRRLRVGPLAWPDW